MSDSSPTERGPAVPDHEDLFRGIPTEAWWVPEEKRPSSAAFRVDSPFSVDIVSLAGSPESTLAHLPPGSGLVQFNSGNARLVGFDARQELDPDYPENLAHAHVYTALTGNGRKKAAQKLVGLCTVVREPTFIT
jgi:hypothetical protein